MESRNTVLLNSFAGQQGRHRHREQTYGHSKGVGREGGKYEESNMETYILPYVNSIAFGNLFCDSEDSNQGSATTYRGGMGREVGRMFKREGT